MITGQLDSPDMMLNSEGSRALLHIYFVNKRLHFGDYVLLHQVLHRVTAWFTDGLNQGQCDNLNVLVTYMHTGFMSNRECSHCCSTYKFTFSLFSTVLFYKTFHQVIN